MTKTRNQEKVLMVNYNVGTQLGRDEGSESRKRIRNDADWIACTYHIRLRRGSWTLPAAKALNASSMQSMQSGIDRTDSTSSYETNNVLLSS